jgi:hypothetical protein
MGADLCGYILVGPGTLDRERVDRALARVERLQRQADTEETDREPLRGVVRRACDEFFPGADLFLSWLEDIPSSVVTDFAAMWNDGGYRDRMERSVPGDPTRKIVVVGERTWGDGPDEESAWYLAEAVDRLGLFDLLGIE